MDSQINYYNVIFKDTVTTLLEVGCRNAQNSVGIEKERNEGFHISLHWSPV